MDVLLSRHPSRLQDNMMPMSPDDYRVLSQYVSPRDIDAVVRTACHFRSERLSQVYLNVFLIWVCVRLLSGKSCCLSVCLLASLSDQQSDFWIWTV